MKKRAMAMFLGLTMALSLSVPAFAAPATPVTGQVTDNKDGTQNITGVNKEENGFGQGSNVEWKAEVVAGDVISVVMPTSVDFYIKLEDAGYQTGTPMGFGTVLSGAANIVNNSTCAINLSCVGITDGGIESDATKSAGTLPNEVLSLVQLALANNDPNKATMTGSDFTAKKLTTTITPDAPLEFGSIPKPNAKDPDANTYTLWMNGKKLDNEAGTTWEEVMKAVTKEETITATVTTTLKVSVAAVTP